MSCCANWHNLTALGDGEWTKAIRDTVLGGALRRSFWNQHRCSWAVTFFSSKNQFSAIESFGVAAGSVAFHPAQSHEGQKRFPLKPVLAALRLESLQEVMNLLFRSEE